MGLSCQQQDKLLIVMCMCASVGRFETPWTVVHQAPLSVGFYRQEYWSGLSRLPPKDLSNPGIKPTSLMSPACKDRLFTTSTT